MKYLHDEQAMWFLNRGTGVILLVLLTLAVALGVASTVRTTSPRWPRFVTQALHRNIALLAVALLAVHVTSSVIDEYVNIRWFDAFIPFIGQYEGLWLALGTVALDLVVLAAATSLVRHRFGLRSWRVIHLTTYLAWVSGTVHGFGIGTDHLTTWSVCVTAGCVGIVAGSVAVRLATRTQQPQERRLEYSS
jgi:sulfoxide reductase heme-binding subunit YedZ